jgi:hypothetical protein
MGDCKVTFVPTEQAEAERTNNGRHKFPDPPQAEEYVPRWKEPGFNFWDFGLELRAEYEAARKRDEEKARHDNEQRPLKELLSSLEPCRARVYELRESLEELRHDAREAARAARQVTDCGWRYAVHVVRGIFK